MEKPANYTVQLFKSFKCLRWAGIPRPLYDIVMSKLEEIKNEHQHLQDLKVVEILVTTQLVIDLLRFLCMFSLVRICQFLHMSVFEKMIPSAAANPNISLIYSNSQMQCYLSTTFRNSLLTILAPISNTFLFTPKINLSLYASFLVLTFTKLPTIQNISVAFITTNNLTVSNINARTVTPIINIRHSTFLLRMSQVSNHLLQKWCKAGKDTGNYRIQLGMLDWMKIVEVGFNGNRTTFGDHKLCRQPAEFV